MCTWVPSKVRFATGPLGQQALFAARICGIACHEGQLDGPSSAHRGPAAVGPAGLVTSQYSIGYVHVLSKQTDVYGIYTFIDNGDATAHTANTGTGAGPPVSLGNDAQSLIFGVRVRF